MRKIDNHSKSAHSVANTIDSPRPNARVYDQSISISGKISDGKSAPSPRIIRAWIDNVCIGETRIIRQTRAKDRELKYKILAKLPEPLNQPRSAVIAITVSSDDKSDPRKAGEVSVELVPGRLHERHYGDVVPPNQKHVLHRENIYGSGPPAEEPSPETLELVLGYLPPQSSIVDLGCGAGAYGPELISAGHRWFGLELNDHCIALLERRKLPYRKLTDATARFPCVDREFDHAICIEVLEHIEDTAFFLREIARVIHGRALFSVPNIEVLPYFKDWDVVPWHLLEGTHMNFFTRTSLRALLEEHFSRVEIFSYGEHPLRTRDEVPLHLHLFAVAES